MAPIVGLLIEYFVIGGVAALWVLPLAISAVSSNAALQKDSLTVIAATFIPALYVVGMVCDLFGQKDRSSTNVRISPFRTPLTVRNDIIT